MTNGLSSATGTSCRTAPPDRIEEAHREAFEGLTPEQRRLALQDLNAVVPESERGTADDPRSLARTATRAEMREPGTVERAFGRGGMGGGVPLLPLFMTTFIGTLAAQALFSELAGDGGDSGDSGDSGRLRRRHRRVRRRRRRRRRRRLRRRRLRRRRDRRGRLRRRRNNGGGDYGGM